MLGTVSMLLASTAINVALPTIMGTFGIGPSQAAWLSTGFLASTSATMLVNAWAVESFGQRRTYVGAMIVFMLASAVGGFAVNEHMLVLARVLQGAMAGIIQPLAMLTIFQVFPLEERGRGMGIFGFGVVLAPALGPVLGGFLVDLFSWRAVFFVSLPVCAVAIFMGSLFLLPRQESGARPAFDRVGFVLLATALTSLLVGLSNGQRMGWDSLGLIALLGLGVVAAIGFVLWSSRHPKPLLNLNVYQSLTFACGSVLSFVLGMALFGTVFLVPLLVQQVQGLTATQAGVLLLPSGLLMAAAYPFTGRLADSPALHKPILAGLLALILSNLLMRQADVNTAFWTLTAWILLGRLGLALLMPSVSTGSMRGLPPPMLPQGSGSLNFSRQLGGAFGINLISLMLERRTEHHVTLFAQELTAASHSAADLLTQVGALYARAGVPSELQAVGALEYLARVVLAQGLTAAFHDAFLMLAFVYLFALIPALLMARGNRA